MDQAREPVACRTPDACAERRVALVEHHARRRVERVQPDGGHVVEQPLDARLVRDGRKGVRRRCRWVGRVLTTCTVHLVELLRLGVVRLHDVVADRPGRRDAVVVLDLAEVALAQPVKGRSVKLGRPADEVVDLGLKRLAVAVEPPVGRHVAVLHEHRFGVPVLGFAGQPIAALEYQHALAGRCQPVGKRATAGSRSHDDQVVMLGHHPVLFSCGRTPVWSPVRGCRARCLKPG